MFKKHYFSVLMVLIVLFPITVKSAEMVPSNILTRVFSLRIGNQVATGFTIEVDNRQYLITAKHLIAADPSAKTIGIYHDKDWITVPFQSIPVEPNNVDIAVLAFKEKLSNVLPITMGIKSAFVSQSVFFVGFPTAVSINGHPANAGYPIPIVKHGIIAAFGINRGEPFIVDGINNPGFSGGPVVIAELGKDPQIIGVISGYTAAVEPVFLQGQKMPDLSVQSNTGLLIAFPIDYAVEAIQKNPIGYLLQ